MPLCNLLVHLDSGERSAARLKLAADIARSRGARLTGLFAQVAPAHQVGVVTDWPTADYTRAADASRAAFLAATGGLDAEWHDLNRGDEGEMLQLATDFARHFDVIVLGQRHADNQLTPPDFAEQLILNTGRPVLVVPHAGVFEQVGARPVFAWSDSRCSARGFFDGMTLVAPGADTIVVGLAKPDDAAGLSYQKESLRLAVAQLAAHKVPAKLEQLALSEIGLMDALLKRAADHKADLLAIGAFGGRGYPLFSRGSGSRYMLKHMTVPVLFSH
jgi:nucleotide-binding universal stress UspA family protein